MIGQKLVTEAAAREEEGKEDDEEVTTCSNATNPHDRERERNEMNGIHSRCSKNKLSCLLNSSAISSLTYKSVSCLSVCHQAQMEFCNTNIWPGWLHQRYLYKSLQRSCMHFLHGFLWQWIESLLHAVAQKQQIILTVVFSVSTHSTDVIHNSTVLGKVAHRITLLRPIQRFIYTCYLRGTKTPSPLENTTPNRIRLVV